MRDGYGDLSYADTYRGGSYSDTNIRVAPGSTGKTYAWKEQGFTHCSASCLGGIDFLNNSIIHNINLKTVSNFDTYTQNQDHIHILNYEDILSGLTTDFKCVHFNSTIQNQK